VKLNLRLSSIAIPPFSCALADDVSGGIIDSLQEVLMKQSTPRCS
jgi:hypothetical protein